MATSFKEWAWPLQALFWLGLLFVLVLSDYLTRGRL